MIVFFLSILSLTAPIPEESYTNAVNLFIEDYIEDLFDDEEDPISEHFLPFIQGTLQGLEYFVGSEKMAPVIQAVNDCDQDPLVFFPLLKALQSMPKVSVGASKWIDGFNMAFDSFEEKLKNDFNTFSYSDRFNIFGQIFTLDFLNMNLIECLEDEGDFEWEKEIDFDDLEEAAAIFLLNPTVKTKRELLNNISEMKNLFQR